MHETARNCGIAEKQNSDKALRYIAAWSWLYGRAKLIAGFQFWFAVPGALAMSTIALFWPDAKVLTTPIALIFGWLDILLLDPLQNAQKKIAAKVQELFDHDVFDLEWNEIRCGSKPEHEIISEAAETFKNANDISKHIDWYPPEVKDLPLPLARLICQRAALWWDMSQRKKYGNWLLGISVFLIGAVVILSFTVDIRVRDMILGVYLPIAPAVVWSVREYRRQRDAATSLEKLKVGVEKIWDNGISGKHDSAALNKLSRNVQDMIFDGRSRNPLLFNCIYSHLRDEHEVRMNETAKEMVAEALAKKSQWRL